MNDRIRELAEQALFESDFDDEQNIKITMDIFAELIVRECAQFVEDKFDFVGDEIIVKEKLLEYFGVK